MVERKVGLRQLVWGPGFLGGPRAEAWRGMEGELPFSLSVNLLQQSKIDVQKLVLDERIR